LPVWQRKNLLNYSKLGETVFTNQKLGRYRQQRRPGRGKARPGKGLPAT
jgi:hypothetical protein